MPWIDKRLKELTSVVSPRKRSSTLPSRAKSPRKSKSVFMHGQGRGCHESLPVGGPPGGSLAWPARRPRRPASLQLLTSGLVHARTKVEELEQDTQRVPITKVLHARQLMCEQTPEAVASTGAGAGAAIGPMSRNCNVEGISRVARQTSPARKRCGRSRLVQSRSTETKASMSATPPLPSQTTDRPAPRHRPGNSHCRRVVPGNRGRGMT